MLAEERVPRVLVFVGSMLAFPGWSSVVSAAPQGKNVRQISVDAPRPLAEAFQIVEQRHGRVITYEDPRYVHESDLSDVTLKVRRDLSRYPDGQAPKVLIPRYGRIDLTYTVSRQTGEPEDIKELLQTILDANVSQSNPGVFRLEQADGMWHVIPTAITKEDGVVAEETPILDSLITLEKKERNGIESLEAICAALRKKTREQVTIGTIPTGLFLAHRISFGAKNESARSVLASVLRGMPKNPSWQLFYDPGSKLHVLNMHLVASKTGRPSKPAQTP